MQRTWRQAQLSAVRRPADVHSRSKAAQACSDHDLLPDVGDSHLHTWHRGLMRDWKLLRSAGRTGSSQHHSRALAEAGMLHCLL